ncbi:PXA domain-containing protein [Annulohypoxylon maeteangense]|uniref:PXA domain-containing protein n=1 Tax=Annulohypoxylon maeteangense TaxID=1927788 RepID=UPI002007DAE6|nr:PXA domain-containing protein [Annulohypoxylon maeteangense]KAI0885666.1 PXA domain-containing protein [Annulohypoxylon maeteangense]
MNTVDDAQLGASPIIVSQDETKRDSNEATIRSNGNLQSRPTNPKKRDADTSSSSLPSLPSSTTQQDIVTKILQFLSTATPGTIAAIAVGLAAITYFILGQIGLLLIGAVAGIILFATWESQHPEVSRAIRGEKGYDFLERILESTHTKSVTKAEQNGEQDEQTLAGPFDDFQPETRQALNALVDAVIRDYVDWWYGPIIPSDKSFPLSCRKVFVKFVLSISNQLSRKRPADAFVDFLTHSCSIIIVFLSEMASAYSELPSDTNLTAADAIYNYLASNTEAPLSNLLNQRQQAGKFKIVAEDLLGFLDRSAYDCDPARVFLREILATIVLEGTLQTCSKAEWINAWIVYLLESGETDLSQAIDDAIQDQKAFGDVDGNVGNIGLSRGNRNSYEMDRARRKESTHKKQLSKADEEMERAMEEMKRLNEMIAEADKVKGASNRNSLENNVQEPDSKNNEKPNRPSLEKPKDPESDFGVGFKESTLGKAGDKEELLRSPISPRSTIDNPGYSSSPANGERGQPHRRFTSFDQIVPPAREDPEDSESRNPPPLTLHNATVTIHDDAGNDKGRLRSKPSWEYLLQIEPATSHYPGWMVMKTYLQFEGLHESLRRIATISGSTAFLEAFTTFPSWKVHTRTSLRGEIERYMRTACAEKVLAESEAFKRFLDKGQETRMGNRGFSFESVGKGMLDVIQNAPKGALDSGKVFAGGVTGVFGNIGLGPRKSTNSSLNEHQIKDAIKTQSPTSTRPLSMSSLPRMDSTSSVNGSGKSRDSMDSQRSSVISVQPGKIAPMERRPSIQVDVEQDSLHPARADRWERSSISATSSRVHSRASSAAALRSPLRSPSELSFTNIKLPPPPDEITDDYGSPSSTRLSVDGNSRFMSAAYNTPPTRSSGSVQPEKPTPSSIHAKRLSKQYAPLSEQETRVAVELLFAVINELYTLSSAWNIRRTLLTAAKSFLLRPGNPALMSIQSLVQESVLEANTSDTGIATHLRKLRENSLPTEEELKGWPKEMTIEEKEELRVKARRLFIQSGVPTALMGIMGQSATSEALGRIFDCLQIEEVSRGLFFGIMLQAVRVVTH